MSLYPKVRNIKKGNFAVKIMLAISVLLSLTCVIVNLCTSTKFWWSIIVIVGIIYCWITVMYSLRRNINIASNVMIQTIAISIFTLCIDFVIGYSGWAINLSIPIIIMAANVTLLVLTFVSIKRYYRYIIYHLIIFILSFIPLVIYISGGDIITRPIFTLIASGIAITTFLLSLLLYGKSFVEELDRRLHL